MQIAVIQFPGSNCERETILALQRAGMEPVEFLWNENPEKLRQMAGFVIVGGFSYEDRGRAGIIAALDPVMQEIKAQSELGKPILGICNGAQILVETGLVPGLENNKLGMALTENKRMVGDKILGTGFFNAWVSMRLSDDYQRNAFTRHLTPRDILRIPIAHGEGRFVMSDALLQEIKVQGLNVFQYCDDAGKVLDYFPVNPNGSMDNIAAISNKVGNVMAIMPHPERTVVGDPIFQSMRDYIQEGRVQQTVPLYYYPRKIPMVRYAKPELATEWLVELIITDNQALTVENSLRQKGIPVRVKRQTHWEIVCDLETLAKIKTSGVLFNDRKEVCSTRSTSSECLLPLWEKVAEGRMRGDSKGTSASYIVRAKEDLLGQQKLQTLKDHFDLSAIQSIKHSVVWHFASDEKNMTELIDSIMQTNILHNPFAHDCYHYDI